MTSVSLLTLRRRRAAGCVVAAAVVSVILLLEAGPTWAQAVWLNVRIDRAVARFSGEELTDAVGLRGRVAAGPGTGVTDVVVTATAAGRIVIQVGVRVRELEISDGTSSADAARLAALLIWDLVRPLPRLSAGASPTEVDRTATSAAITTNSATTAPAPLPAPVDRAALAPIRHAATSSSGALEVSMMASVAVRTTDAGSAFAPLGGAQWSPAGARPFALSVAAGFERSEVTVRGTDGDRALGFTTVPVRVGVGGRVRAFAFRAGVLARIYFTDGLTHDAGVLWGAFAAATVDLPVRGPLVPFISAGLDVHVQPVAFSLANQQVLALHTLAPWIGLGLSWTWGRA